MADIKNITLEELMMMDTAAQLSVSTGIVVTVQGGMFKLGRELLTIDEMVALLSERASLGSEASGAMGVLLEQSAHEMQVIQENRLE